jgi:xylulokinase
MKYLLGADIGTTSLKMILFTQELEPVRTVTRDYTLTAFGDCVEFPAERYWELFQDAYDEVCGGVTPAALTIDTQCETMILTDADGKPLRDAIVWLDNRASAQADEIRGHFGERRVYEICGQPEITATWPACKLLWVRQNEPEVFGKIRRVFLLEDWILYKLTGEFVTEKTLQSSTIYFDIRREIWWDEMLEYVGIDGSVLPRLINSGEIVGSRNGTVIVTGAIDQIAGAIGAGITEEGVISEMTGTTMAMVIPAESVPAYDPESKIPCHKYFDNRFCLLPWTATAGMALKWFRNAFCEDYSFRELDQLAEKVEPGSAGLTFLPYLCGSVMPRYNPEARGAFYGFTLEHGRAHAARAVLESVACMLRRTLEYVGMKPKEIRSMGGGALSPLWCQIKADMSGCRIVTLKNSDTACLGSTILAGHAIGLFPDISAAAAKAAQPAQIYEPCGNDYSDCYKRFCELEDKFLC